jgi:pSer/pThr/pTyr-binding forkhead associated (FHA) protein
MVYIRAWHVDRPDEVQEQELTAGQLTIGRALDNDIQLDVPGASRHHALVSIEKQQVLVSDSGSTNGTWVGGERVERRTLAAGDRFQVGAMVFELATSSLTRPTVVEDWANIQVSAGVQPPNVRLRRAPLASAQASVALVDRSTGRLLRAEQPIPARGLAIGRDPTNDLCLEDGEVSRFHARVEPHGEKFMLQDLGSRNGTWVNRIRVRQHLLAHGDCFKIGTFSRLFRAAGQPAPELVPRAGAREDSAPTPRDGVVAAPPPTAPHPEVRVADTLNAPPAARCPACGAEMATDDRFCGSCGGARASGSS